MNNKKTLICTVVLVLLWLGMAPVRADLFDEVAQRYRLSDKLLRSVAGVESNHHPWTLNVSGEPLFFASRQAVIRFFRNLQTRPWWVYLERSSGTRHYQFSSESSARLFALQARRAKPRVKRLSKDQVAVGLMQIYWSFHRHRVPSFERLIDPAFNLDYGARYLSELIEKHQGWAGVGHYYGGNSEERAAYVAKVQRQYRRLLDGRWRPKTLIN